MKLGWGVLLSGVFIVAPRAGAWVETGNLFSGMQPFWVAPRAGAWVETGVNP